jgi:hypothetical protein
VSAAAILQAARAARVEVQVDGGDLLLKAPACPPDELLRELARNKAGIIRLLQRQERGAYPDNVALLTLSNLPAEWLGLSTLSSAEPAEGFSAARWQQILGDAARFVDEWGEQAVRLGWHVVDVFGVHVRAPSARYDGMGLVPMLRGGNVVALNANRATIRMPSGADLSYLRLPCQDAVPIWDIRASRQAR